jgi:hypothetical protein
LDIGQSINAFPRLIAITLRPVGIGSVTIAIRLGRRFTKYAYARVRAV